MSVAPAFYPWHESLQARLRSLHHTARLPHALLLSGPRHLGKRAFAYAFAGVLVCKNNAHGVRCGQCEDCLLFDAGTHPDVRRVFPVKKDKSGKLTDVMDERLLIVIEQIRNTTEWASKTAQRGGTKVVIIHPAEQMNVNSANALLKSLEEPGVSTVMLLVSDLPGRLLPTIRSRCQQLNFTIPKEDESLAWLRHRMAGRDESELNLLLSIGEGAPLAVVDEFDDAFLERRQEIARCLEQLLRGGNPLAAAAPLARGDAVADLSIIYSLFADALRLALTNDKKSIKNKDMVDLLATMGRVLSIAGLFECVDAVARDRRSAAGPSNPNIALLFEGLFVEIASHCAL